MCNESWRHASNGANVQYGRHDAGRTWRSLAREPTRCCHATGPTYAAVHESEDGTEEKLLIEFNFVRSQGSNGRPCDRSVAAYCLGTAWEVHRDLISSMTSFYRRAEAHPNAPADHDALKFRECAGDLE